MLSFIFKWMEANLNNPVVLFYFIYESYKMGFFSESALWHTFTVKVEEKGLPSVIYRKKERKKLLKF